jgi:hypothetical protein
VADQTIADAVVRPGEASDVALRLRRHWRVLVRTAHRASQHDNPTAVVNQVRDYSSFGSFFACLMSAETTVWVSLPATLANIT